MTAQELDIAAAMDEGGDISAIERKYIRVIVGVILTGLAAILIYATQMPSWRSFTSAVACGMVTAGAALLVGGLTGLLFGIPRRLQTEQSQSPDETARARNGSAADRALYGGNTNLEQISDWLTKILVGVGLTQITKIGELFDKVGGIAGSGMGGLQSSYAFAIALILYFTVSGFLLGYLWTRLYLGQALTAAERAYSLEKRLGRLEQQSAADVNAVTLCARQLTGDETARPTQTELDAALKEASSETRAHIFYRAQLHRWRNWREQITKPLMERTIPIFQALIASDPENRYHANHGQLGFALKDQRTPNWKSAEEALSRAIAIRGDPRSNDGHIYEFNRALCYIMQDQAFQQGKPTTADTTRAIVADLETAAADEWVARLVREDTNIQKWLGMNNITLRP